MERLIGNVQTPSNKYLETIKDGILNAPTMIVITVHNFESAFLSNFMKQAIRRAKEIKLIR
jgi:superfamily II helicase